MEFGKFKKNRGKLKETVNKMKAMKPSYVDDRFWSLTIDKAKNGEAIIRFLPQQDIEQMPIEMYYNHSFKEKGQWLWENCPVTLGRDCPICDYVQPFWDEDTKEGTATARRYSRGKNYVANILVVKDPAKPENNGKVFLYRFGVKIHDKIISKLAPESELEEAKMIHDLWEGQNFLLKCKDVSGYNNYDTSSFYDKCTPIAKTDKGIEAIYNKIQSLGEFVDEGKFKTYEAIKEKFDKIMKFNKGGSPSAKTTKSPKVSKDESFDFEEDNIESKIEETPTIEETPDLAEEEIVDEPDDKDLTGDEEEDFNFDFDKEDLEFVEDDIPF